MQEVNPFRRAQEVLEKRGWCKHVMIDKTNKVCLLGAIGVANHSQEEYKASPNTWFEYPVILNIIKEQFPERYRSDSIGESFNDKPETTYDDVWLVLDKAAVWWDEQA